MIIQKKRTNSCIINKKKSTFVAGLTFQIVKKCDFGKYCPHSRTEI